MALKKSQIYNSLWKSCDELRGSMDASQYKDYVLTLLFMKYVSDKATQPNFLIDVPDGSSFDDMVALKGDKEIGDKINKIIGKLAEANDLKGVINVADFNDEDKIGKGKEMQDRLSKLLAIFNDLDFSTNRAEGDDLLGDAYEFLMRHFATESGKSKGQFYTPSEVSQIMSKVLGIGSQTRQDQTIYDPTCGSGSLLIKAADQAPRGLTIYGQENDNATWALAKMNMILHGNPTAEIWKGNTLSAPYFKNDKEGLQTFDFSVANPPFSTKSWSNGFDPANDIYGRFEYGIPPAKNGDYAFLLHVLKSLKSTGKGAIILPHGVLFRGNVEADIRKNIIKHGFIKGVIGLPANLFYGTGIPACIIILDKKNARARSGIFMIDASKGFIKDGNKNRLRTQDIHKIVDTFNQQIELPRFSRMVPISEIAKPDNDYNLNIPRYIDSSEPEDLHDIEAHLRGGIPDRDIDELKKYWQVFPTLRKLIFKKSDRPGYSLAKIESHKVKSEILAHEEYKIFSDEGMEIFAKWFKQHEASLKVLRKGSLAKKTIETLSEDILKKFESLALLDKYDIYQRLMDYWFEIMQDDVYLITAEGWTEAAKPRGIIEDKERKIKETPDLIIKKAKYKMDLIPPSLIVARYFADEKAAIDELELKLEEITRVLEEFTEENSGDEGLLEDAKTDKGNLTKTSVTARIKEIQDNSDFDDEMQILVEALKLLEQQAEISKSIKEAQAKLDEQTLAQYNALSVEDIKSLVVHDKWFVSLRSAISGELERIIQKLAGRVKELEERYAEPLPELTSQVDEYSSKVETHLVEMGMKW